MMTDADKKLLNWCPSKQNQFNDFAAEGKPYVWRLRLTEQQFLSLEELIEGSVNSHKGDISHLLDKPFARLTIIYLAEWFKRRYTRTTTLTPNLSISSEDRKRLWSNAEIGGQALVYKSEATTRWQDSINVLGGLAIKDILRKELTDDDPFLTMLCKIYNGEDVNLDAIEDLDMAVAAKQSIELQHSLYDYLVAIFDKGKQPPFAQEELEDEESGASRLIRLIQKYDRLFHKDKFDLEWRLSYQAGEDEQIVRTLTLRPRSQNIGGIQRNFISYDLLKAWDIENPESRLQIMVDLRFKSEGKTIKEAAFDNGALIFQNQTTGFVAIGNDMGITLDVPVDDFDTIDVRVRVDDERSKTVQTLRYPGYLQLYKMSGSLWSSKSRGQAPTALIFDDRYRIKDSYDNEGSVHVPFRNRDKVSRPIQWYPINDNVTLVDNEGHELPPFFNRSGAYQIVIRQYTDTIKYEDNLYATYKWVSLDEGTFDEVDPEDIDATNLELLFGRDGIQIRHFAKPSSSDWQPVESYKLEYNDGRGRFIDWNSKEPAQGRIQIRITVKGHVYKRWVYYVPFVETEGAVQPIWRDFDNSTICFAIDGKAPVKDEFPKDFSNQPSTKEVTLGNDRAKVELEVYRAVLLKELYQNGVVKSYHTPNQRIRIPLLICDQFAIRDFNREGVEEYNCSDFKDKYEVFDSFQRVAPAPENFLQEKSASDIIPGYPLTDLKIYLTTYGNKEPDKYEWDYKSEPKKIIDGEVTISQGIVFQSLLDSPSPRNYEEIRDIESSDDWGDEPDDDDWGDDDDKTSMSDVDIFKTVVRHGAYFFLFKPLRKVICDNRMIESIFIPLFKECDGKLDDVMTAQLYLFARQFHFDWMLLQRSKWLKALDKAAGYNDERLEEYKQLLIKFFKRTPKCQSESEAIELGNMLKQYWTFETVSTNNKIAQTALSLIQNGEANFGHNENMDSFLKKYDECLNKFSEMACIH